ncbi:DUF5681 domain-containing protein [Parafrankia sp. BMG5.11]|uniref:DUF5681 domain-containing protein n=1 Tax=Parafrankia sp. BMG5.11 TaxID=222540 RepID=UPI0010405316|nr:DUF5681 domain-containing protein [Parafrankia sp. BMG5.11]TCJ41293.1 hypothetical protein E0504_01385 [Parafrankia sp. BMG5.11]
MADRDQDANGERAAPPDDAKHGYEVGYCRPPKHGQIKPGEVRNKRGPLKGTRSLKNDIREILNMPVPLNDPSKKRKVTTRKAALLKLREKALRGDSRSLDRLLEYAREHDAEEGLVSSTGSLMGEDPQIMANAIDRRNQAAKANAPDPDFKADQQEESS